GCVVFTACAVAALAHWALAMPIGVAFVLGAIVAPPDVLAPLAIVRQLGIPHRLAVVLNGEGTANDATALILSRLPIAAVDTGFYVSWNGPLLIPAATRLQGIFFWDLLVYLLEGIVFLVTGLQIRTLLDRPEIFPLQGSLVAVLLILAVIIVARFVWVYPAAYLPRWLSAKVARRDPLPPWQ